MYLIDYIHFVFAAWGIAHLLAQISDIINTIIAGGINFYNVHRGSAGNLHAGITNTASLAGHRLYTIYRLRKNLGNAGFARTPHAAKQIGVGYAPVDNLICKGSYDMLLVYHIRKTYRAQFAIQRCIHIITT
jgi:hypothetical protein